MSNGKEVDNDSSTEDSNLTVNSSSEHEEDILESRDKLSQSQGIDSEELNL